MDWPAYLSFLGLATLLVLVPGADFAVVVRNALVGGRRRGWWAAVGVTTSNLVQGAAAAAGLAAVIVRVEPLFQAIRWAGIAYLAWLGVQALRSALRGDYPAVEGGRAAPGTAVRGWRQGFLSNITNPKVLVFYLAVLPQFLGPDAATAPLVLFAGTHAVVGLVWLVVLVLVLGRARRWLARRRVRRALDTATGLAMLGFSVRLATERT
ncbi:Threonine/homoserine/homoserine lactone efflux protein [Blastococcus sp. DSM 46786]|uniref:LysE family translocator n=1 Tax=Blastococcus sp. DSM 46786 TaxID=1798227 RepID=UPI0008C43FCB|nr:LysE family translocator [Blastococcus sp. DSM 46786]SEL92556.1 Threonine/homoserine/homoserine lactone efflux protein [Blastococcus sp. DSM 46786]